MKFFKRVLSKLFLSSVHKRLGELEQRAWRNEYALMASLKPLDFKSNTDVGFNDQRFRKEIFSELNLVFQFEKIVETGTFSGNTTGYFSAQSGLPIDTAEISELFYYVAKKRLSDHENITLYNMDSVSMLSKLASNPENTKKKTFFYLDAHWYDNLPLTEEIETICKNYSDYVIMIDDFKVENDPGYKYDDYGVGKSLSLDCFGSLFNKFKLDCYFPVCKSSEESGNRTGSVILLKNNEDADKVSCITKLYKYDK